MRTVVIADRIKPPYDEGIKNIAVHLIKEICASPSATLVTDHGVGIVPQTVTVPLGTTFACPEVNKAVAGLAPNIIIYIPSTSVTLASFLRALVLKLFSRTSKVWIAGFQTRSYSKWTRFVLRLIRPHGLIVLSEKMRRELNGLARNILVFNPGADLEKFTPVHKAEQALLRSKYGIRPDDFVILHVGHLKKSRNLRMVLDAMPKVACTFVMVASSTFSNEQDSCLWHELIDAGVLVINGTVASIEEFYKMADCYVFPVMERTAATEMPLSVIEAMATNLPVVTTPYGALPETFPCARDRGLCYASDSESFVEALQYIKKLDGVDTRSMVTSFSWSTRVATLMQNVVQKHE